MKRINFFVLALVFSTLTACGGGDGDGYGGPGTPDGPGGNNTGDVPAAGVVGSVIISYSNANAVEDNKNGTYSRKFSVLIRDQDGTPLPDDTRVDLQVVDTVIAQGTLGPSSDTATGTTLSVSNAVRPDSSPDNWADNPAADFNTASVSRPGVLGGSNRLILADDLVIMTGSLETAPPESAAIGQVDSSDVSRTVANDPTLPNQLTISEAYLSSYPAYGGTTNYYIAASMLSAGVSGEVGTELTPGYATTKDGNGVATVWVTYASNALHIRSGCVPAAIDARVIPAGSAQPMLVAKVGDVTAVMRICFNSIAGYVLKSSPEKLSIGASVTDYPITICAVDGGDNLRDVPYAWIGQITDSGNTASTLSAAAYVDATDPDYTTPLSGGNLFTRLDGCFRLLVTTSGATSGDTGTITVEIADGTMDIPVTIE